MKDIFVDAVYGNLEDGMPQLNISVSYSSGTYSLCCVPCIKTDTGMQFQFGVTHCNVDLETVSRANKKVAEKWQLWAEDHKWGILKAFTEAGEALYATRDAIKAYVKEWAGKKYETNDSEKSQYYPEYDLDLTPSEKAALDAGTKRFNFTTGELDDVEPEDKKMIVSVDTKELQKAIKDVATVVAKKASLWITESILVTATDRGLKLTAYNCSEGNDMSYSAYVDAEVNGSVPFIIDAKMAKAYKSKAPMTNIQAEKSDDCVNVEFGTMKFSNSISASDFPPARKLEDGEHLNFAFDITDVANGIVKSCADDNLRPQMSGVYFDMRYHTMVASDGITLRVVPFDCDVTDWNGGFIMSRMGFDRMTGRVKIEYDGDKYYHAEWAGGKREMTARVIEGRYPNWFSVIPKKMPLRYKFVDTQEVRDAFDAINAAMGSKSEHVVHLRFTDGSDEVEIFADDLDFNIHSSSKAKIDSPAVGNLEIGIGLARFRSVPFKDWDGTFYAEDCSRAVIMGGKTEGSILLMMPMMLNECKPFDNDSTPVKGEYDVYEYVNHFVDPNIENTQEATQSTSSTHSTSSTQSTSSTHSTSSTPETEPTNAEDVVQNAEKYEPQDQTFIPHMPDFVMWVNEDPQQPEMVAAIHKFLPITDHMSADDATIYHKIVTTSDSYMICLETSIYMKAVNKMVTFSFYSGEALGKDICKMTNGDSIDIYTWDEGMSAIDILHQVNTDIAL